MRNLARSSRTKRAELGRPVASAPSTDKIAALTAEHDVRSNVTVEVGHPIVGWWDDLAVEEIVRNLLSNALKFGEGRPIRISVTPMRMGARVVVRDEGK